MCWRWLRINCFWCEVVEVLISFDGYLIEVMLSVIFLDEVG